MDWEGESFLGGMCAGLTGLRLITTGTVRMDGGDFSSSDHSYLALGPVFFQPPTHPPTQRKKCFLNFSGNVRGSQIPIPPLL